MNIDLLQRATTNVTNIISLAIGFTPGEKALVVYDTKNELTNILTAAYRRALPDAQYIDFDSVTKAEVIAAFDAMSPGDLVVLIQSSNFLLDAFRIRLHLFQKKLKVIEHLHLHRNREDIWDVYINSLEYDPTWYRVVGPKLKNILEVASSLTIESGGETLEVSGKLETPKLNIGDYKGMENIGGTFPIGEVFTEAADFTQMNGSVLIYAFAGGDFCINMHEPFRIDIEAGQVVSWGDDAPEGFINIIKMIKEYERPLVREIGFGLNRAITRERYPQDITAFERILGLHLSLGEKHSVYKKDGITTHKTKFHVDVFPVVDRILADGNIVFADGNYTV